MNMLARIALNGLGLWAAAKLLPGIHYDGGLLYLLLAGFVLGAVNLLVKPIVTLLSLPFVVLTLGLFFLVINGLMVWLVAFFLTVIPRRQLPLGDGRRTLPGGLQHNPAGALRQELSLAKPEKARAKPSRGPRRKRASAAGPRGARRRDPRPAQGRLSR